MSWSEQSIFFGELPAHLQTMALFKVNTGTRQQKVCKLRWGWEIAVPELGTSVFLIPADFGGRHERSGVKNGDERLVVLNSVARSIITEEDRKVLLGHKNGSITSYYSGAELGHLIEAATRVSATDSRGPVLAILKRK